MSKKEKDTGATLANNANKYIPHPKSGAQSIDGIVKASGEITGYHLSDGKTITKAEGVAMAKQGMLKGVAVAENQGSEYLRTIADDTQGNNLSSLPVISE